MQLQLLIPLSSFVQYIVYIFYDCSIVSFFSLERYGNKMSALSKIPRFFNTRILHYGKFSCASQIFFNQSGPKEKRVALNGYDSNTRFYSSQSKYRFKGQWPSHLFLALFASSITALGFSICYSFLQQTFDFSQKPLYRKDGENVLSSLLFKSVICKSAPEPGEEVSDLPTFTAADVAAHDSLKKHVWVSFKSGVYDVTNFIPKHPGGDKILMAAGGGLEPFWELFAIHKKPEILAMLEEYRIGNLSVEDRGSELSTSDDPFANDPRRHPVLQPRSEKPYNAEPPPELLVENFVTPNELFFVRNHLPVPDVDPETYELEISGIGMKSIFLSLNDLKTKFKKHSVTVTLQCAGNRRSELNKVKEVKGLSWGYAAISTAEWTGVKLVDVLKYAKVNLDDGRIQHIQFEGLDTDPANVPYGASIPAEKGLNPKGDVILAFEMNGQELPKDHGYPVRVVIPGVVGARNVKWLAKIVLSEEESESHWQRNDYKGFSPSTTWENVDFKTSPAIQEQPVNSAICKPSNGFKVKLEDNKLTADGYAWSGGGRKIVRVDVSADNGATWHVASLQQDDGSLYKSWAWTLWKVSIPIPKKLQKSGSEVELICKAIDSSYNVQPDTFPPIWNLRGVLGNAWHRIKVKIQ